MKDFNILDTSAVVERIREMKAGMPVYNGEYIETEYELPADVAEAMIGQYAHNYSENIREELAASRAENRGAVIVIADLGYEIKRLRSALEKIRDETLGDGFRLPSDRAAKIAQAALGEGHQNK